MDDNTNNFALSAELFGDGFTSIDVGETVVFLEIDDVTNTSAELAGFREFWFGANVPSNFKLGSYSGGGLSFSSNGDGVVVFDSVGTVAAQFVSFGAATAGRSFDNFDGSLTIGLPASVAGLNGAFVSNNALGNIGSPGISAVPEPSALVVLALVGLTTVVRRRR